MDKKVLVTGGSGLVGTYLKDIMPSAIYVSSKDFNLLREDEVKKMFKEIQPNIVVHLAAYLGDEWNHHLDTNIIGCYNVFEAARLAGVKNIIFGYILMELLVDRLSFQKNTNI